MSVLPPAWGDRPERVSSAGRPLAGPDGATGGRQFAFAGHVFRSPRTRARALGIGDHVLELVPDRTGLLSVRARLSWESWNYQSFPEPDFYPPRIGYRLLCGDGTEIAPALMLILGFAPYDHGEAEREIDGLEVPPGAVVDRARWTILPYPERAQAYRLKRAVG